MELKGLRILLISPEPWEHIPVSKHHYARTLAERGNEVFFLAPPGDAYEERETPIDNLFLLSYTGFPKGFRFFPTVFQRKETRKVFDRLEALAGTSFDILWSFDNSVFFEMSGLPGRVLRISQIVDLDQDFQTAKAASTADICFCTTPFIRERLRRFNPRVHEIGHGVAYPEQEPERQELPGENDVKALFAGNLDRDYLDRELLGRIAQELSDLDLILMGPAWEKLEGKLGKMGKGASNVHFIEPVPAEELPSYYASADILLLPYREAFQRQMAAPHKALEYLMSGKVVVATWTESYKDLDDELVRMCRKNADFPQLLRDTMKELDRFNASELMQKRREYAKAFSYEERIRTIEGYLAPLMKEKGSSP